MFVLTLYTYQIWFTSKVRYNGERGEYKRGVQTALKLTNSLDCAKSADGKAARKKPVFLFISTLLRNAWDISGAFLYIMYIHTRTYIYAQTCYARSTARPCLADHPHGYSTAASAVLLRRKVLNGETGLKKGSRGANANTDEGTSGVISCFSKKLYFMIAATFKPLTMQCVRSLARTQLFHAF